MKIQLTRLLPAVLAVAVTVPTYGADKEITIRRAEVRPPEMRTAVRVQVGPSQLEKENVAFLGVQTAPVSRTLAPRGGPPSPALKTSSGRRRVAPCPAWRRLCTLTRQTLRSPHPPRSGRASEVTTASTSTSARRCASSAIWPWSAWWARISVT